MYTMKNRKNYFYRIILKSKVKNGLEKEDIDNFCLSFVVAPFRRFYVCVCVSVTFDF